MKSKSMLLIMSIFTLSLNMMACHHECGTPAVSTYYASVTIFDEVIGINTQIFNFTQTQKSYAQGDCSPLTSSTNLEITNLTPYTASYEYTITYNLNLVSWQKQGSVIIAPQATINVGEINESGARIDLGQIIVTYSNVSYR